MIIGLTGGIATGKSTVSNILSEIGIKVIDADKIAHKILDKNDIIKQIKEQFGKDVIDKNKVNRYKLGKLVFNNHKKRKKLEEITHPQILKKIIKKVNKYKDENKDENEIIVLDVPLLFETGLDKWVDEVWLVFADYNTQLKRIIKRDGLKIKEAKKRINAQMSLKKKRKKADIIIKNEGTIQDLRRKILNLVEKKYQDVI